MFYRQAGIHHTNYRADRQLFPIPFERWQIGGLLLLALAVPAVVSSLYMKSYVLPWLIWTAAALGLNLILGWAGQFHFGYAAIMGIGAYTAVHATLNRIPFEIALVLAGLMATVIGCAFAITALRVRGLYLALSTLALQFMMDWVINKVPAVSGGTQAMGAPPAPLPMITASNFSMEDGSLGRCEEGDAGRCGGSDEAGIGGGEGDGFSRDSRCWYPRVFRRPGASRRAENAPRDNPIRNTRSCRRISDD